MKLKAKYERREDIPPGAEGFYVEQDGAWVMDADVEDHPAVRGMRTALDKERGERKSTREELAALKAQLEGLDLDQARELLKQSEQNRHKKLIEAGKVDELVAEKTKAMREDFEKRLADATATIQQQTSQLEHLLVTTALQSEATSRGVRKTALDDVILRGKAAFRVKDGKAVRVDGENVVMGKNGTDPMSIGEWLDSLVPVAPHLFEDSKGGGARGNQGGAPAPSGTVSKDPAAIGRNLEAIAAGKVSVDMGGGA